MLRFINHRWQFSLSLLLGVMLICALGAGVYRYLVPRPVASPQAKKDRALSELSARGFSVAIYDDGAICFQAPLPGICGTGLQAAVDASPAPRAFTDRELPLFDHLGDLRHVNFTGTQVSQPALAAFHGAHPHCSVRADFAGFEVYYAAEERLQMAAEIGGK